MTRKERRKVGRVASVVYQEEWDSSEEEVEEEKHEAQRERCREEEEKRDLPRKRTRRKAAGSRNETHQKSHHGKYVADD